MNRQTRIIRTYINLARGVDYFPRGPYTNEMCAKDATTVLDGGEPEYSEPGFYSGRFGQEICTVRGISMEKYYEFGVIEKPTQIANAVYASILRKLFGDTENVKGFLPDGKLHLPQGQGVFIPMKAAGEIVELKFYHLSRMLKGK